MKRSTFAACLLVSLLALARPRPARAGDPFEIQVYDGTANAPGVPGLELHLNDWASGRRAAVPPELPLHGQAHATLEPSLGVVPGWEVGAYLQGALEDDGTVRWAGAKLRSKFVTTEGFSRTLRLGLNLEVSALPEAFDRDRWGVEIRPIVAWASGPWLVAFNPILDQSLAGPGRSDGPSFEPALKATRAIGPVALGLEYYATIGPVAGPPPLREQDHTIFEVVDVLSLQHIELNAGVGEGLTPASAGVVLKAIVGYTFDP
jgi:hypothetical protein